MDQAGPKSSDKASSILADFREWAPRILLVDSDRRHLNWLSRILRRAIAEPEIRQTLGEMPIDGEYSVVVANFDNLAPSERALLVNTMTSKRFQTTRFLLLSRGTYAEDLAELIRTSAVDNLIATDDSVNVDEFLVTIQKLRRNDIFGIEKYFVWGTDPVTLQVRSTQERDGAIDLAEAYTERIGIQAGLARCLRTVADEVITNALYNAPVDANGTRLFAERSRGDRVELPPGETIDVHYCCDGMRLGISATDPYGSLTRDSVLQYVTKWFEAGQKTVEEKPGGAGLGLYYVFDAVSHFVVNIEMGKRTELIGLIDVRGSYRDFANRSKSLNIFVAE